MKKHFILVILIILAMPNIVLASSTKEIGVMCSKEEMLSMQEDLKNVKINIEMLSDNAIIENEYGNLDVSNSFKVSTNNLPSQYEITIYSNKDKSKVFVVTNKYYSVLSEGGVYVVNFKSEKCGLGIIKSFEMMIPFFDKTNTENVWFDGTYEYKSKQEESIWEEIINGKLLMVLIILIIIIIGFIIIIFKKSKKKIGLNVIVFLLLFAPLFAFSDNVFADLIVDSDGITLDPVGGLCDNCGGTGTYIMTGVGFKMSLVNVTDMYSVNSFIVLNNKDGNVPGGLPLAKYNNQYAWYYKAIEAAENEGVYGEIGGTYSTSLHKYSVSSGNMEISDSPWFLNPAGYNRPNVNSSEITKRLFGEDKKTLQPLFYEYLYRLLKGNEDKIGISTLSNSNDVSTLINASNKVSERQKLVDYRIIAEPIYIAKDSYYNYRIYTIKAAYIFNSQGSLNISYPQFKENFIASQEHGQINSPTFNNDVKDSKSGYGYVVYGIVDKEITCDPKSATKCCYDENKTYKPKWDGKEGKGKYKCNGTIGDKNECLGVITECVQETPKCEDTKVKSVCETSKDGKGTKAVFHENDNLKECTLDSEANSGFTIVSKQDTTPNSKKEAYCEVACKDDLDFEFPMKKFAMAGTYFVLDQYTPKVKFKRTCVTSKISYSTFEKDFNAARDDMIKKYNTWQDYLHIYNKLNASSAGTSVSGPGGSCGSVPAVPCTEVTDEKGNKSCVGGYEGCSGGSYGSEEWEIYPISAINYSENSYSGTSGTYYWTTATCCGSSGGITLQEALAAAQSEYLTKTNAAKSAYDKAKSTYNNIINAYQKCGSWITEQKTQFDPKLKLTYPDDLDSKIFANNNLAHDKTLQQSLVTKLTYWTENSETNNKYTSGGDNTKDSKELIYVICSGTTCTSTSGTKREFLTSAYIKREESLEYIYHLPTVYTAIPSGKVYLNKNGLGTALITLEKDSVPVNVKTLRGLYNYNIEISKITDTVRDNAKNKNNDHFKTRFEDSKVVSGKQTNDGMKYVCDYKVENDIYEPKTGENLFFYRPVEIEQVNPLGRELGYNWNDTRSSVVKQNMVQTGNDYQQLTNGSSDKFEFVLTPTVMKAIRSYNVTHDYGGFNLKCSDSTEDDYYCKSAFLDCLASLSTIATSSNLCNNILEGRNLTNPTDYGYDDLQANRTVLINKLKSLPRSDI